MKDRTAYGLTLLNAPSEDDDETQEYVFEDVFQHYGILGSGWGLDEENLYWIDHDERLTELENPKRSFLEVRGRKATGRPKMERRYSANCFSNDGNYPQ